MVYCSPPKKTSHQQFVWLSGRGFALFYSENSPIFATQKARRGAGVVELARLDSE